MWSPAMSKSRKPSKASRPASKMPSPARALSIRQPYAEDILRGTKRIEYRSRPTTIRERVYIYASLTPGKPKAFEAMGAHSGDLPTGVLVGTVEIVGCTGTPGNHQWHLRNPARLRRALEPRNRPLPAWFFPF